MVDELGTWKGDSGGEGKKNGCVDGEGAGGGRADGRPGGDGEEMGLQVWRQLSGELMV